MRIRLLTLAVIVAVLGGVAATPASAQSLKDLVDQCLANGGGYQFCRGLYGLLRTDGGLCRDATGDDPGCAYIDGVEINEALVTAQEDSWLNRALAYQRGLDDSHPLQDELWTHTHNTFNADAYDPTFYGLDRNQIYTITDQLRMGIRAIELDLHYALSTNGDPANNGLAVLVCHGNRDVPVPNIDLGCGVNDPLLSDRLPEIRAWLDNNPDEVVMIYLENQLQNLLPAHDSAAATLEAVLGDLIYKPATKCGVVPYEMSRKQIHDAGKRVILVGNCGPGSAWGGLVHDRNDGGLWRESGLSYGDDFTPEVCAAERTTLDYPHNWIRHYGDETGLSAGSGGGGDTSPSDAFNMTRCGVNMIGEDNLVPFDQRLVAEVWSWNTDEPSRFQAGSCAVSALDGRFVARDCSVKKVKKHKDGHKVVKLKFTPHRFACHNAAGWHVTHASDRWDKGSSVCASEGFGTFAVPWNGYENELLKAAKGGAVEVYLNYSATNGVWAPGA